MFAANLHGNKEFRVKQGPEEGEHVQEVQSVVVEAWPSYAGPVKEDGMPVSMFHQPSLCYT